MMMTPAQCRAARGLLKWSTRKLAGAAGVGTNSLNRFENGSVDTRLGTVQALQDALTAAGIEFTNTAAPGVTLRSPEA